MNQSRFRRLVALLMKTLGRQVRRTIRMHGVPVTPEQRADVAAALLPHVRRARAQSHTLGVQMLEPQARALGIVTPPARPVRPYNQRAVETMLENVTNMHPRPSRARVTVDPDAPEVVRGPRVTVAALDPVTRRRARVTVDVTEENRRDPQVVKAVSARLEAAAERHARMPSREALTDALAATPIVPVRAAAPAEDPEADFVWDDDDLLSPDDVNAGRAAVIGWARVLTGEESCAWCAMLASRGPVFSSERDAQYITSRSERFDSRELKLYHDNCDCEIVMVRDGVDWNGRQQYEALEQLWIESTLDTSGDDSVKAFAQVFNQRVADGEIDQYIAAFAPDDEDNSEDASDVLPADPGVPDTAVADWLAAEDAYKASMPVSDATIAAIARLRSTMPADEAAWSALNATTQDRNGAIVPTDDLMRHLDSVMSAGHALREDIRSRWNADTELEARRDARDAAFTEMNRLRNETIDFMGVMHQESILSAEQKRVAELESAHVREALAAVREFGGHQQRSRLMTGDEASKMHTKIGDQEIQQSAGTPEAEALLRYGERYYPTEWLQAADARGSITLGVSDRPFFQQFRGGNNDDLLNSYANSVDDVFGAHVDIAHETVVHELGHRMEASVPGLMQLEFAMARSRAMDSDGTLEDLVELYHPGSNEWAYKDQWTDAYAGKSYARPIDPDPARVAHEVFQVGTQDLFGRGLKRYGDETLEEFTLGVLVLL